MSPGYVIRAIAQQRRREAWSAEVHTRRTRAEYARAWKAWKKANHVRRALAALTGNRNGPAKAWADECRVMLARAERAHRRALQGQREEKVAALRRAVLFANMAPIQARDWSQAKWPN